MIQAVIFDMDGTLIDSEPMWKEAEQHVFSSVGVGVTEELSALTATMTTREVTQFWYRHAPWQGKSIEQVENEVVDRVETLISSQGVALEGVNDILAFFKAQNFKIGLSTNSPHRLIDVVLNKLGITHYFDAISSSEHETQGKPEPDVYLSTLKKLKVDASRCIAFEDSYSGLLAAQKAEIKTIAVPAKIEFDDNKFDIAHIKLSSLADFTDHHLKQISNRLFI